MSQPVNDILDEIDALPDDDRKLLIEQLSQKYAKAYIAGESYTFWFNGPDEIYLHLKKEEDKMDTQLKEANDRVDQILPDLWAKAEQNLKEAEAEYKHKKEEE